MAQHGIFVRLGNYLGIFIILYRENIFIIILYIDLKGKLQYNGIRYTKIIKKGV